MNLNQKRDLLAGLSFIAISLLILFVAIPLGVQEPKKVKFVALSPSYYPRLVCYCLLLFGLVLLVKKLFTTKKRGSQVDGTSVDGTGAELKPQMLLVLGGVLFFYYITLPSLGFVLSSTIVLFVLLLLAGDRSYISLLIIPLLLPIAVYWFFTKIANIPIPAGILEPVLVGA